MNETTAQRPAENKMGVMPINRLLITMSLPMIVSMLVQALYNIVDSMFVAQLSENALTAVSLAFPVQSLMIAVGSGTGVGINATLSRSLGEKNFQKANRIAIHALQPQGQRHVLQHGEVGQHMKGLEHEAQPVAPQPGQAVLVERGVVAAIQQHPPRIGAVQPGDQVEQGRLAHPRLPDDRHILPRRQPQGHLGQHPAAVEGTGEGIDFQHGQGIQIEAPSLAQAGAAISNLM